MNFRSVAQLSDQVLAWSKRLPRDIDVVCGVPRSGLLVANLLALYRNLPLTDPLGLIEGRCTARGQYRAPRLQELTLDGTNSGADDILAVPRNVLVVDDSIRSGGTMALLRESIEQHGLPHRLQYGAMYACPEAISMVDFHGEVLDPPRVFEWNLFRNAFLSEACLDMDGVLCVDPDEAENDDGDRYERFLDEARPLFLPTKPVGWIVTSRLERYRPATERWLERHDVQYRELVMLDYPDGATRRRFSTHGPFKADAYRASGASMFLESSVRQAIEIAELSRRDVVCTDTMQLVRPGQRPVSRSTSPAAVTVPMRRRVDKKLRKLRARLRT